MKEEGQNSVHTINYTPKQKEDNTSNSRLVFNTNTHNAEQQNQITQEAQRVTTKKEKDQSSAGTNNYTNKQEDDYTSNSQLVSNIKTNDSDEPKTQEAQKMTVKKVESQNATRTNTYTRTQKEDNTSNRQLVSNTKTHDTEQPKNTTQEAQRVTVKKQESQNATRTNSYSSTQKEDHTSNASNTKTHDPEQPKNTTQESQGVTTKKEEGQTHSSNSRTFNNHAVPTVKPKPAIQQKSTILKGKKEETQNYECTKNDTNDQRKDKTYSNQAMSTVKTQEVKQQQTTTLAAKKEERQNECAHIETNEQKGGKISKNIFSKLRRFQEPKEASTTLQNHQNDRRLEHKSSSHEGKPCTTKTQTEETVPHDDNKQVQDQPRQRKHSSSTLTVSLNMTSPQPHSEPNTSSTDGSHSKAKTQVFVSSVKIPRRSDSGLKSPPPVPEVIEEEPSTKAVRSEVFIPAVSNTSPDSKHDRLTSPQTTATSFVRLGRLTSSVRTKSHNEDENDGGFTRSSNLRFSLRSRKIEDRMEKYTSAIQKSASVRIPGSRAGIGAPDGIANKRTIFEKEEENPKASTSGKDLTLPGSVTSRINQWSNKAQQSSGSLTGSKDIRTGDVATKRMLWQQRSQSSNDTKF